MRVGAALLVSLSCACSENGTEAPIAQWSADPQALDNPLPDDRLLANGTIGMRPGFHRRFLPEGALNERSAALFSAHAERLAELEGWGTYASILVPFSEALDDAPSASFRLVSLDGAGEAPPLEAVHHPELRFVELVPSEPLTSGARYAYVVERGLTAGGVEVERAPDHQPSSEVVAASGVDADDILLAVELTTRDVRASTLGAAQRVAEVEPAVDFSADAGAAPWPHGVHERDAFVAAIDVDTSAREAISAGLAHASTVAVGTFETLDLRGPHGAFDPKVVDGTDDPAMANVELIVVLPDPVEHPPPWRTTLVQHGFGGNNQVVLERAEMFNQHGIAVVGIDALGHGNRGSFLEFFAPADARVGRDNLRQTLLDQLQLCRVVAGGAIDLDGQPGADLDGSCDYWGQSMGAMLGALHMGVTSSDKIAVLNVGGAGLSRILLLSDTLSTAFEILLAPELGLALGEPAYEAALPLFMWSTQTVFEDGDPINYGPLVFEGNAGVLMQLSVGDGIMPNAASKALAAAIGLSELTKAETVPEGIDGAWWIDLVELGVEVSGAEAHDITRLVEGVRQQAGTYIASRRTELLDPTR